MRSCLRLRAAISALQQRADRLALDRARIPIRRLDREDGGALDAVVGHPDVAQGARTAEPADQIVEALRRVLGADRRRDARGRFGAADAL